MSTMLVNEQRYARLLDGTGSSISSTAGALDINVASGSLSVDLSANDDSVLIYGWDGAANQKVKTDNAGRVLVDATMQIANADIAYGQAAMAASLPVVLSSDHSDIAISAAQLPSALGANGSADSISVVATSDGFAVSVTSQPVANKTLWNAASTGVAGNSSSLDTTYCANVTFYGTVSAATTLSVFVSPDDSNWYDSGVDYVAAGSGNFYINMTTGAKYVRLQSSADVTATAYADCKI